MSNNTIIAVVGLPGSGKTEATKYIEKNKGFNKVYLGEITFEELKKRGLEINEANERMIREDLRKQHGMGAYAKLNLPKIETALEKGNVVVESLYSWDEYKILKNKYADIFKVIAVYSSPRIRYQRLINRPDRNLTEQEAQSRDYAQIENLDIAGPIAIADQTIINDGGLKDLHKKIDQVVR